MHCIESAVPAAPGAAAPAPCSDSTPAQRRQLLLALTALSALVASGCGNRVPPPAPVPAPAPGQPPYRPLPPPEPVPPAPPPSSGSFPTPGPSPAPATNGGKRAPRYVQLPPAPAPRSKQDLERQFARRLVDSHPDTSYTTPSPPRLLAIPVLEIELNGDGSVRGISVLRKPSTGNEATELAIAAIRRAAPYGDVSKLPKPWKLIETFLFDDDLRFKPRILDIR